LDILQENLRQWALNELYSDHFPCFLLTETPSITGTTLACTKKSWDDVEVTEKDIWTQKSRNNLLSRT
jgi:hypothetical protein